MTESERRVTALNFELCSRTLEYVILALRLGLIDVVKSNQNRKPRVRITPHFLVSDE